MLIDRYPKEDIFAHVPKMTGRIDPVLQQRDRLLDDDEVYQQVRNDFGKRHRSTLVHGRHSTPVEVLLRMLLLKHLYGWSYQETAEHLVQQAKRLRSEAEAVLPPGEASDRANA